MTPPTPPTPHWKWLRRALICAIALGIICRFVNISHKPYWQDEIYTLFRVSGYGVMEVPQRIVTGQILPIDELLNYQRNAPDSSAIDTIRHLAYEVPEHPPLYFVLLRQWTEWFGSGIVPVRLLSVLFSLLCLPTIAALAQELFGLPLTRWMAIALFAISPLYLRYAEEARPYSLWMLLMLLSSFTLLRSLRQPTKLNWSLYGLSLVAGMYCHLFSALVFLGQGFYVLILEKLGWTARVKRYAIATVVSAVLFLPWAWVILENRGNLVASTAWVYQSVPLPMLVRSWGLFLCQTFFAWHFRHDSILIYLAIPVFLLSIYSLYFLCRSTPKRVWLFILLLVLPTAIALMIPDLIFSTKVSKNARYFLPCYLGIHLAVAHLLSVKLTQIQHQTQQRIWQGIAIGMLSLTMVSSAVSAQADTWWGWSEHDVVTSGIVNQQTKRPLIVTDQPFEVIFPLAHRLKSETSLMLLPMLGTQASVCPIPARSGTVRSGIVRSETVRSEQSSAREVQVDGETGNTTLGNSQFSDVFFYAPSASLKAACDRQGLPLQLVYQFRDRAFVFSLYRVVSTVQE